MPAAEHPASDTVRCFVLTDIRMVGVPPRSVAIVSIAGRELTAITTPGPKPGSLIQLNLGDQGWVDAVVSWTGDEQSGVRLQREITPGELLGEATRRLPGAPERRMP